jgi:SAM-dependent methyltransferase
MTVLSYIRQFGVRNAATKAWSLVVVRMFSRKLLAEDMSKDLSSVKGAKRIDTGSMSSEYRAYVEEQISRSVRRSVYLNPLRSLIGTRDSLIQQVVRIAKNWELKTDNALSIGCRDERELNAIERLLRCASVTGVDLFSASPRILAADMHELPFENDRFDVAVAIHSMEHSYSPQKSLSEMLRVTKPGGLLAIEVPVRFPVTQFDRNDFRGVLELAAYFPAGTVSVLWAQVENRAQYGKPPTLRAIFQKQNS